MLDILGQQSGRFCDGVSRRDFLRIGALGMGGVALPELLQAEAQAGVGFLVGVDQAFHLPGAAFSALPGGDEPADGGAADAYPGVFACGEGEPLFDRRLQRVGPVIV